MFAFTQGRRGAAIVAAILFIQLAVFALSMDAYTQISVLCTGPASSGLSWPFGLLHIAFLALFLIGILSFALPTLRLLYIALMTVALLMLPVQASLVSNGTLSCDGP